MAELRLVVAGVLALAAAAAWTGVGIVVLRQRVAGASGEARRRFAIWWLALAAYNVMNAALGLAVAGVTVPIALVYSFVVSFALLIVVMFWGLMSYIAYLVTGRAGALRWTTRLYALQLVALLLVVVALDPTGAHAAGWTVAFDYAHGDFEAANVAFALVFLLPPLLAAIAYLGLWIRVRDPAARLRIALVGGSITAWLVNALLSARLPNEDDALQVTLKALGIVIALGPLVAYRPPRALAGRLPVHSGEVTRSASSPEQKARAHEELRRRVHDLI
jgi:hypothetical protein